MRFGLIQAFALLSGVALCVGHYFIWSYAPLEQTMGEVQKIFYVHLPLAWWALFSFLLNFIASSVYLFKHDKRWDTLAGSAAEVGVVFSGLALITGSIWARHSWGVWWTWDPRLMTTLIMWYIYAGYLVVRALGMHPERKAVVCAVIGVVAFLDVPLVFYSSKIWGSYMHPPDIVRTSGGLDPQMRTTLFVNLAAWTFIWLCLLVLRTRQMAAAARLDGLATYDE